jgi:hypothetical protein
VKPSWSLEHTSSIGSSISTRTSGRGVIVRLTESLSSPVQSVLPAVAVSSGLKPLGHPPSFLHLMPTSNELPGYVSATKLGDMVAGSRGDKLQSTVTASTRGGGRVDPGGGGGGGLRPSK